MVAPIVRSLSDFLNIRVDSGKLPIVAAGQVFECENDSDIHVWERTQFTARRMNATPICQIEVTLLLSSC